ncbi:MAG: hypothetical protein ACXAB7_04600 [Candidatus Kariarchaeaceae archaeon]|jgi:hypothetical protein
MSSGFVGCFHDERSEKHKCGYCELSLCYECSIELRTGEKRIPGLDREMSSDFTYFCPGDFMNFVEDHSNKRLNWLVVKKPVITNPFSFGGGVSWFLLLICFTIIGLWTSFTWFNTAPMIGKMLLTIFVGWIFLAFYIIYYFDSKHSYFDLTKKKTIAMKLLDQYRSITSTSFK